MLRAPNGVRTNEISPVFHPILPDKVNSKVNVAVVSGYVQSCPQLKVANRLIVRIQIVKYLP